MPGLDELREWSERLSLNLLVWTVKSLNANPTYLENKKRLLRYCCAPTPRFDYVTRTTVLAAMRNQRTVTIDSLLAMLPSESEDEVIAIVASEIREGRCHSDIETYAFDYATTLSVHHEIAR